MDARKQHGFKIAREGGLAEENDGWVVPSETSGKKYFIGLQGNQWTCSCPDYHYRHETQEGFACKHIHAVFSWQEIKKQLIASQQGFDAVATPAAPVTDATLCPYCLSPEVVKNGCRKNACTEKQRFKCQSCRKTFLLDAFKKFKGDGTAITLAMDLYYKGLSLRKIQDTLKQFHGIEVHFETIRRWITTYTEVIKGYTDELKPAVGKQWHCDEMKVKKNGKWVWLWNMMDKDTRFMLANRVSKERYIEDARAVFRMAKETAGSLPNTLITDGLDAYGTAFWKEFKEGNLQAQHIYSPKFADKSNNNLVERLNGSFRERNKVQRGLKQQAEAQFYGYKTYYNFLRPHQTLGCTPAEKAGISLDLHGNKWQALIEKAITTNSM